MPGFLEAIDERVLVSDGAMGTVLYGRGVFLNRCFDELNLSQPSLVTDVHLAYLQAGADVLETNTFGANRCKLEPFGLAGSVAAINAAGARLARGAAGEAAWVAGAIGPLGIRIEPWGRTRASEAEAVFREQAEALAAGGVDLFVLETFRDVNELTAAVRAVRAVSGLPIVAQLSTGEDTATLDGTPPEIFTPALEQAGADVIGVNCAVGPAATLDSIEAMARHTSARLSAQPNAGRPRQVDGRNIYLCSPEYLAGYTRRFVAAGVRLIGGCCGTTPAHIREIARSVPREPGRARTQVALGTLPIAPGRPPVPREQKSALARALVRGQFAVIVEVPTPRGADLTEAVRQATRYRDLGATAVSVPDYPRAGARASAMATAVCLERHGRIEAVLHYCCRDRNLIGMQSDLVGAHALGVRNVLVTTGTPASQGAYADATPVFDVDAVGLTALVGRLNEGADIGGRTFGEPTRFHVGVAVNPFGESPDAEWQRLQRKIDAGAEFIVTPPLFDLRAFDEVLPRLQQTGLPVLAGLAAIESLRHVEFLTSEVVGVRVPDGLLARLAAAEDESRTALEVMLELAVGLQARVQGLHVTVRHGSPRTAERLLAELGRLPQRIGSGALHV